MAASDEAELVHMVATQVAINDRPSAVRVSLSAYGAIRVAAACWKRSARLA